MTLTVNRPDGTVHRVGFQPDPWAWTPWQYGPFTGRWDDPEDLYRVIYAASSPLGCFLEVLAVFRPDPAVAEALARIQGDEIEDSSFAAAQPGKLDRSWLTNRRLGTARLGEDYVDVGHSQTIAHLRPHFIQRARELGLPDFDAAAIRISAPRILTQEISRFLYGSALANGAPAAGIEFGSRHGDDQQLWAVFERDSDIGQDRSHLLSECTTAEIDEDDRELREAMRLHNLEWADG